MPGPRKGPKLTHKNPHCRDPLYPGRPDPSPADTRQVRRGPSPACRCGWCRSLTAGGAVNLEIHVTVIKTTLATAQRFFCVALTRLQFIATEMTVGVHVHIVSAYNNPEALRLNAFGFVYACFTSPLRRHGKHVNMPGSTILSCLNDLG